MTRLPSMHIMEKVGQIRIAKGLLVLSLRVFWWFNTARQFRLTQHLSFPKGSQWMIGFLPTCTALCLFFMLYLQPGETVQKRDMGSLSRPCSTEQALTRWCISSVTLWVTVYETNQCQQLFTELASLTEKPGAPVAEEKTEGPIQTFMALDMELNTKFCRLPRQQTNWPSSQSCRLHQTMEANPPEATGFPPPPLVMDWCRSHWWLSYDMAVEEVHRNPSLNVGLRCS